MRGFQLILMIHHGLQVITVPYLPYDSTVKHCNIATRQEHERLTGEIVHALQMGGKLYVSKELYEILKNKNEKHKNKSCSLAK